MRKIFLILTFLFFVSGVFAAGQSISIYSYDFYNNTSYETTTSLEFSSVKINLYTTSEAFCKHDIVSGISFLNMQGNFDLSSGTLHEKSFTNLGDGVYTFFVKCSTTSLNGSEPAELKLVLRVNSLVTGQIVLEKDPPLKSGRTELTLLTSKSVYNQPSLTYSFDGLVYNDLPLFGSDKIWKGYLIVPKTLKDAVVSFKFRANDLEGRQGTQITSESVFIIDTIKPILITDIDAIGYVGEIRLTWHDPGDEDIIEYNIYRDDSPNVDYNDYYTSNDDESYLDTSAEKGKTYYYRVTALDEAGNEGDLSKEVYATSLKQNVSSSDTSRLNPSLVGDVENFLVEVDSIIEDIDAIKYNLNSRSEREKNLFSDLGFEKSLNDAKTELANLEKEADNFKLQDLTKDELTRKLDVLKVKLGVIKKKPVESLSILEDDSRKEDLSETSLREAFLIFNETLSEKQVDKNIKDTLAFIETSNLEITSDFYVFNVVYMDGSTSDMSVVKRTISGEVERNKGLLFVEIVSKEVAEDASQVKFVKGDYSIVKADPVFSFETDTKQVIYSLSDKVSLSRLEESNMVFLKSFIEEDTGESGGRGITGYFLLGSDKIEYGGISLGIIILLVLILYFAFLKKKKISVLAEEIIKDSKEIEDTLNKKNFEGAKASYKKIQEKYKSLESDEKKKFHKELLSLHDKILVLEIEEGINNLKINKDKEFFKKIEEIYLSLSEEARKRVEPAFNLVKKDFMEVK